MYEIKTDKSECTCSDEEFLNKLNELELNGEKIVSAAHIYEKYAIEIEYADGSICNDSIEAKCRKAAEQKAALLASERKLIKCVSVLNVIKE